MDQSITSDLDFLFEKTVKNAPDAINPMELTNEPISLNQIAASSDSRKQQNDVSNSLVTIGADPAKVLDDALELDDQLNNSNLMAKHQANIARLMNTFNINISVDDE